MNTFNKFTLAAALTLGLCLAPQKARAQVALTQTTTSAAIDASATLLSVVSSSGITANVSRICIYDIGTPGCELASIKTVNSSTRVTLNRTNGTAHLSGAVVVIAPTANAFRAYNPRGSCTANQTGWTPWLNTNTGEQWLCGPYGWAPGWHNKSATPQLISATGTASVAGATGIAGPLVEISGTNAITSFTMAVGWAGDSFCIMPTAAYTTVAGNNIAEASTADANQLQCWMWNAVNSNFQPTY